MLLVVDMKTVLTFALPKRQKRCLCGKKIWRLCCLVLLFKSFFKKNVFLFGCLAVLVVPLRPVRERGDGMAKKNKRIFFRESLE